MTISIVYLNPCRRERLRLALAHAIQILGPYATAQLTEALAKSYLHHRSPRHNYNCATHALLHVAGIEGLAAISIIKEAWNEGCLSQGLHLSHGPSPANITHMPTNTLQ